MPCCRPSLSLSRLWPRSGIWTARTRFLKARVHGSSCLSSAGTRYCQTVAQLACTSCESDSDANVVQLVLDAGVMSPFCPVRGKWYLFASTLSCATLRCTIPSSHVKYKMPFSVRVQVSVCHSTCMMLSGALGQVGPPLWPTPLRSAPLCPALLHSAPPCPTPPPAWACLSKLSLVCYPCAG